MSSYYSSDLRKDVNRAEKILSSFVVPGKSADIQKLIPPSILAKAHGIMFIRLYRVGLLLSAKGGTGIIIARLPDGTWSAPSGISLTSVGFGHLAGGEVIDSIIVMNYRAAVKAFFDAGGQIQLGMGVSVAAGPLGRSASVAASASNKNHIAATYAYSSSKGLFVGYSFEGSKISERHNTNASFYGRQISAQEILTGAVPPPQMAAGLYNLLNSIGASGQQPGITFGPNNRYSAPPLPPHPHLQQKQHSYPPSMSSHSPTLSNVPSSMAPPSSPTVASPVSPSTTVAYPNEKNPQDHQFYNNQQPSSSYNNQQQTAYNNQQPSFNENQPSYHLVAKYDFTAQQAGDLSFKVGDHITVTQWSGDKQSWWFGFIGHHSGQFPANFVDQIN
ncbi:hypothetical protein BJ944DRAFT_181632 [Cunninghamella echinulata]|nr:hypothetical protein BJ944DRAFT_181632 [Cunninghamella echinulata]